jgi:hypothetical protein
MTDTFRAMCAELVDAMAAWRDEGVIAQLIDDLIERARALLAQPEPEDRSQISDGYHTFAELYEHRHGLTLALMKAMPRHFWFSQRHHDGELCFGEGKWFIIGAELPDSGEITYHLPNRLWGLAQLTGATELEHGPTWDGHTAGDVVHRLKAWAACPARAQPEPEGLTDEAWDLAVRLGVICPRRPLPSDGGVAVNLRMDLSSECMKRLCNGLVAAVKPNGGYRALTTDDVEWWLPEHGCDSLENTLDAIKGRLCAAVRDWLPTAVAATPQPPADGEVGEVIAVLREMQDCFDIASGMEGCGPFVARAADLLERQHLQPVAVSERLPGAEDCIKRGNDDWCWGQERSLLTGQASARWRLMRVSALTDEAVNWLFANALPIPKGNDN